MNRKTAILTAAALLANIAAHAGSLSTTGISVLDNSGAARATFTNSERIRFQQRVNNGSPSSNFIRFTFTVNDPSGAQVFRHYGNGAPGRVGNAATNVSGVPISRFFSTPGVYTLVALAELDGQTVSQSVTFTVSSPNILLVYPPNGSQGLTDQPLIFRWNSSGAASYRLVIRSHSQGLKDVFNQNVGAQNFYAMTGVSLSAGENEVYDWRIEGLDQDGNKVAESDIPFSFTLASSDPLTRDLAVSDLQLVTRTGYSMTFRVVTANQGGTSESNVELKFSLGGIAAEGSPVTLPMMQPGGSKEYEFAVLYPVDQPQSLATACLSFFDDNVPNNCKTMQIQKPPDEEAADTAIFDGGRRLSMEELWSAIESVLAERGMDFSDYGVTPGDPNFTASDLAQLLDALRSGLVEIEVTGPPVDDAPPADYIPPPISGGPPPVAVDDSGSSSDSGADSDSSSESESGDSADVTADSSDLGRDWRGNAPAMSARMLKMVLREKNAFEKFWTRISNEKTPKLDFKRYMLVAVMAGSRDRANGLDLVDVRETPRGLQVRYRLMVDLSAQAGSERASVPFHMMVIPQSGLAVEFKKVKRQGTPVTRRRKAAPGAEPAAKAEKAAPAGNAWGAIREELVKRGLDFAGYEVLEIKPNLTGEELKVLLDQIRDGSAAVDVAVR
jgi:hypothetical protein